MADAEDEWLARTSSCRQTNPVVDLEDLSHIVRLMMSARFPIAGAIRRAVHSRGETAENGVLGTAGTFPSDELIPDDNGWDTSIYSYMLYGRSFRLYRTSLDDGMTTIQGRYPGSVMKKRFHLRPPNFPRPSVAELQCERLPRL